jgi:RNA polymerase sigma-70 factor (ECF subfamily)
MRVAPVTERIQQAALNQPERRVRVAKDREVAAGFQRAVAPHQATLRASALRLTRNRADADDLVQDALLRAFRFWDRYHEEDSCRAWLQRILVNTFYSERRAHTRKRAVLAAYAHTARTLDDAISGEPEPSGPVSQEHLQDSLGALRPEQRHILRLVDMHEHTYREAAASLDCPIGTVMSRLHRARAALRSQLNQRAQQACA